MQPDGKPSSRAGGKSVKTGDRGSGAARRPKAEARSRDFRPEGLVFTDGPKGPFLFLRQGSLPVWAKTRRGLVEAQRR